MEYNVVKKKTNRFDMTITTSLILIAIVGTTAGVGGAAAMFLCCPRQAQMAPRRAPEVEVAQIPNGNALEVVNGVHERLPAGEGEVILIVASPFEPLLFNPTYFWIYAIIIFFVFCFLVYVVIRVAKNLLCTNHFVRIH